MPRRTRTCSPTARSTFCRTPDRSLVPVTDTDVAVYDRDGVVCLRGAFDAVIVNGTLIRRDGKDAVAANDRLPGRLLRHGRAA